MSKEQNLWVIILAGGRRVLDETTPDHPPKLLEKINSHPVLHYVIQAAQGIQAMDVVGITVVVSARFEDVLRSFLYAYPEVSIAVQEHHRGTADAVWSAIEQGVYPKRQQVDQVLVLMGDQPLVTSDDLDAFCSQMDDCRAGILTFMGDRRQDEFHKCGVVLRDRQGQFVEIRSRIQIPETDQEELHAGPYLFGSNWLRGLLTALFSCQRKLFDETFEFHLYLALVAAAADTGVCTVLSQQPENFLGVDTLSALKKVRQRMHQRLAGS